MPSASTNPSSLELILSDLFDYAGMYPPALKTLEDALLTSGAFAKTLLRPYLVGADLVMELSHLPKVYPTLLASMGFSKGAKASFCLLGSTLQDPKSPISDERLAELVALETFNSSHRRREPSCKIVSYEIKLAKEIQTDAHFLKLALRNIKSYFQEEPIRIWVEPDLSVAEWQNVLNTTMDVLKDLAKTSRGSPMGLKVRCSGPSGIAADKLAEAIQAVSRNELDLKATAGLHHPIIEKSRFDNSLGFLNLAVALFLARASELKHFGLSDIQECLLNQDPQSFTFGETFGWKDFKINLEELSRLKSRFSFSIGSCSIHEPDEDLNRLFGAA